MKIFTSLVFFICVFHSNGQAWEWAKIINGNQNDYTSGISVNDSGYVHITGRSKAGVTFEDDINPITPNAFGHTDAFVAKYDKDGNLIWANQGGGSGPDWGWGVTSDNEGNTYFTGEYSGTATFGTETFVCTGIRNAFISKLDRNGNFVWTKSFGGTGTCKGQSMDIDNAGNIYCTGFIGGEVTIDNTTIGTDATMNAFILKLDPDGNYIHIESIEPDISAGYYIKCDKKGFVYLTGEILYDSYVAGYLVTGPTSLSWRDAFLAKLDTSFQTQWVETVSGFFHNVGQGIAISDSSVYMTGCYSYTSNFSGISLTYNGDGTNTTTYNSSRDAFVSKYDFDGNIIWAKGFGGKDYDYGYGIDVSKDDNIYFTGRFEDTVMFDTIQLISSGLSDIFIAKLDSSGNVEWAKKQGLDNQEYGYCLEIDSNENIYAGGTYYYGQYFDDIHMFPNGYNGYVGKITQHTYPEGELNYSTNCENDTFALTINTISSPVNFEFDLSPEGWSENNTYYFIVNENTSSLAGRVITSNNIYNDTIYINEIISANPIDEFSLGNDTATCDYNSFISVNGPSTQNNYLWSTGESSQSIDVNQTGIYTLQITNENSCESSDTINVNFIDCTGVNEIVAETYIEYIQNYLVKIHHTDQSFSTRIINMDGKIIMQSDNIKTINLENLPKGIYIVHYKGNTELNKKIIIF